MLLLAAWCALCFGELADLRRGAIIDLGERCHRHPPSRRPRQRGGRSCPYRKSDSRHPRRRHPAPPDARSLKAHLRRRRRCGAATLSLFPAADGVSNIAPSTLYRVVLPGPRGRWTAGPALARPPAHRGGPGRSDGRHAGRADGSAGALHSSGGTALPACRPGSGRRDRSAVVGDGGGSIVSDGLPDAGHAQLSTWFDHVSASSLLRSMCDADGAASVERPSRWRSRSARDEWSRSWLARGSPRARPH